MAVAFVLINTEMGSETEVLKAVREIEGVKEAHLVFGVYDIVAKIEADPFEKIKEIVRWRIQQLKVHSTLTLIVSE